MHAGERVRGYLAALDLKQQSVATELGTDPGTITRRLDALDPWEFFLLGKAVGAIDTVRRNGRNQSRQTQR